MRKVQWKCDGCDALNIVDDGMPQGWDRVDVVIGNRDLSSYDLCGFCQNDLVEKADPTGWPRVRAAK